MKIQIIKILSKQQSFYHNLKVTDQENVSLQNSKSNYENLEDTGNLNNVNYFNSSCDNLVLKGAKNLNKVAIPKYSENPSKFKFAHSNHKEFCIIIIGYKSNSD